MEDLESYKRQYVIDPTPPQRFEFVGLHGIALFYAEYDAAVAFYSEVLGPPAYVEGENTKGWLLGSTWLTLLRGGSGHPQNMEVAIIMPNSAEAERLQAAFIAAGATGPEPSNELMYDPVRYCPVVDPFGTDILVYARL